MPVLDSRINLLTCALMLQVHEPVLRSIIGVLRFVVVL